MSDMSEASVFPWSRRAEHRTPVPSRPSRQQPESMIDAATPLLGMVMRLSTMNSQAMPEHLFARVVTDVRAVEQLLQNRDTNRASLFRSVTFSARLLMKRRWATAGPTKRMDQTVAAGSFS